jgi:hypothetical protein
MHDREGAHGLSRVAVGASHAIRPLAAGAAFARSATLDPLTHILDIGPPLAGLGSWHRAMLTAPPAAEDAYLNKLAYFA